MLLHNSKTIGLWGTKATVLFLCKNALQSYEALAVDIRRVKWVCVSLWSIYSHYEQEEQLQTKSFHVSIVLYRLGGGAA